MGNVNVEQFKLACTQYLSSNYDINALRPYGRLVGVYEPTKLNKALLIEKIVAILCGELAPVVRSTRGAPLKNDFVNPAILQGVDALRVQYLHTASQVPSETFTERYQQFILENKSNMKIVFKEDDTTELDAFKDGHTKLIHRGQLQMFDGLAVLLPLDCVENGKKILISTQLIHEYDLREGDVVSCEAQKGAQAFIATKILTINEMSAGTFKRKDFEMLDVGYPKQRLSLYTSVTLNSILGKYIDWLLPIYKGQRCLIKGAPKTGKTALVFQLADVMIKANAADKVFVLLNGQSPEVLGQFKKKFAGENLLCTAYDDDPEKQVFVAEYVLKRAKRYAETGRNVVLLMDSISALAAAYNETKESSGGKMLACGLESKTLQFIKKYFGAARAFENGGSLTICATACMQTGNPADDVIGNELSVIANHQIALGESLARQRIYPSILLSQSYSGETGLLANSASNDLSSAVSSAYLPKMGEKTLLRVLDETDDCQRFEQLIAANIKK